MRTLACFAAVALLTTAGCSKQGPNAAEQDITKNPQSDAEIAKQARKIEAAAEEGVKKVEATAKTEIDASEAEAKESAPEPEPSAEKKKAAD